MNKLSNLYFKENAKRYFLYQYKLPFTIVSLNGK